MKNVVTAGVGATVLPTNSLVSNEVQEEFLIESKPPGRAKKIIIGGAGIGGLCSAYELMKKGHEVVVLEASGRHGGHVFTTRDELSDGLYGDFGQEHIVKPGYERYWKYLEEFNITALPYPRRKNLKRKIDGKFYTEDMLKDASVLRSFGFNKREVEYLSSNPWPDLISLYTQPYLDAFTDEYQPFGVGYDDFDHSNVGYLQKRRRFRNSLKILGWE